MTRGTLTLDQSGRFNGMHNGTVVVTAGIEVEIAGMINGTVVVEPGADVLVSGMVNGALVDRGGGIRTTGMVTG